MNDRTVTNVRIEYDDGTVRELDGEDAAEWAEWIDGGMAMLKAHGGHDEPSVCWSVSEKGADRQ